MAPGVSLFVMRGCCRIGCALGITLGYLSAAPAYRVATLTPPAPPREFRGVWVATVNNIDWPSKPGLTTEQQKAELRALLDLAVGLRLNVVVLQVRPMCDALYASKLEPWSEYLTGAMGQAPAPFYDPLTFAVAEAHRRGLELHAWVNPFRARHNTAAGPASRDHVTRSRPNLVVKYGQQMWLDPGLPQTHDYSVKVILDVVRRYDIDGIHLDDYFYPYPERNAARQVLDFPDEVSWRDYLRRGGRLTRDDWRRDNVNRFVERLYRACKNEKRHVRVGLSPFGIWRPGSPPQIRGFDAYAELYADSRTWLVRGWLDYFAPQLYWSSKETEQSYPVLLEWWTRQNPNNRLLCPGSAATRAGAWGSDEILSQVRLARQHRAAGNVFWSASALRQNRGGTATALRTQVYQAPALVPAAAWLSPERPGLPTIAWRTNSDRSLHFIWSPSGRVKPWQWLVQTCWGNRWTWSVYPAPRTAVTFEGDSAFPDAIAVTALDRVGNGGRTVGLVRVLSTSAGPAPK